MTKRLIPPLEGDRVVLRLLEEADLPRTLAWRNQEHIRRWFVHSALIAPEQHRQWFAAYRERDDDFVFVIEETRDLRKPVGQVSLYRVDWNRHRAEYGRLMIGEADAAGRGLAREATALLVRYAMTSLGMREIELEVFAENATAIAIYTRCGFVVRESRGPLLWMMRTV
ncbi:MAG TPA: GNAT family N-acetyltransferase [Candidatus Methylomirabilis sp.]|nr:GNAT family N-acetyltransferase [Candidatus Methylomirabilis sp.]